MLTSFNVIIFIKYNQLFPTLNCFNISIYHKNSFKMCKNKKKPLSWVVEQSGPLGLAIKRQAYY